MDEKDKMMRKEGYYTTQTQSFGIGYGNDVVDFDVNIETDYKGFSEIKQAAVYGATGGKGYVKPVDQTGHLPSYDLVEKEGE